jgi:hypothetical protein
MPGKLSELVESPVATPVADDEGCRTSEMHQATVAIWNRFVTEHGSFSDEHSTL